MCIRQYVQFQGPRSNSGSLKQTGNFHCLIKLFTEDGKVGELDTEQGQNLRKAGRKAYPQWHHKDALLRTLELTLHTLGCGALSATAPGPEAFILSLWFQVLNRNSQLSKSTCSILDQETRRGSFPL